MATTALQAYGAEATTKAAAHRVLIDPVGLLPTCLFEGRCGAGERAAPTSGNDSGRARCRSPRFWMELGL